MNLSLRRSTSALLASSLLLTIGRGATLPFMTIYLSRQYSLSVDLIGYAMTIALTIGVVFSLGFGILADKFDKKRYMLLAITAFASGFIAIPLVNNVTLVVLFFALINCAYSVFATVLKAWFADNLSSTSKTKIFSINYTMLNIGWTIGPPLGTLLVMQSINLPFWLAAICSAKSPSAITITYCEMHEANAPLTKEARKPEQVNHNSALSCNKTFGDQTLPVSVA
ncbi:MFS transporter, partial [Escherichia sp. SS-MK2]